MHYVQLAEFYDALWASYFIYPLSDISLYFLSCNHAAIPVTCVFWEKNKQTTTLKGPT